MVIEIPLSKRKNSKHGGKYVAIIDDCDADLALLNWKAQLSKRSLTIYAQRSLNPGSQFLHRVILSRVLGREITDDEFVDHVDRNGLNCTRENLRLAIKGQNQKNVGKTSRNKSGYKGVRRVARQRFEWGAQIQVDGKQINLGVYETPEEAYQAYCEAAIKYHGEFANLD